MYTTVCSAPKSFACHSTVGLFSNLLLLPPSPLGTLLSQRAVILKSAKEPSTDSFTKGEAGLAQGIKHLMPVRFKAPNLVLSLGWSVNLQKAQKINSKNLQVNTEKTENAFNVLFYDTKRQGDTAFG